MGVALTPGNRPRHRDDGAPRSWNIERDGWFGRLTLAIFGLLSVTTIASIYLIAFDNDHNQTPPVEDPPAPGHDDGREMPQVRSGHARRSG